MKTTRYKFEKVLEGASPQSIEYLKGEFRAILESDKDYTRKADYIGFSIASIDDKIDSIDEEIKELQALKKTLKEAKEISQEVGAEIFSEYGIDRLEGVGISSITISEGKQKIKEHLIIQKDKEDILIALGYYKRVVDEEAVFQALCGADTRSKIESFAEIEIINETSQAKLKINKRRGCSKADLLLADITEAA